MSHVEPARERPYSRKEFDRMTLEDLEKLSGVQAPPLPASADDVEAYREQAWLNYQQDITNRDELGGIDRTGEPPPAAI